MAALLATDSEDSSDAQIPPPSIALFPETVVPYSSANPELFSMPPPLFAAVFSVDGATCDRQRSLIPDAAAVCAGAVR